LTITLRQSIKEKARQLGFILAGVTSCQPPEHYPVFESWLNQGLHGTMNYLAEERSRTRRADPKQILPECQSILVLAMPYSPLLRFSGNQDDSTFRVASYALGDDYHEIIPPILKKIVDFIEEQVGHSIPNRYYTDTGPTLERELAQRAGLGWIGKNSMLINPGAGSTFFLAEILLGIELEPDEVNITDHCGTCTRCITACPTQAILPDRTLDAHRCISYLTIELKGDIPPDLRSPIQDWIFGCDICQMVCPWNRFSAPADSALESNLQLAQGGISTSDLSISPVEFNQRFKRSPIKRAKRRGFLRNLAVAIGNKGNKNDLPLLEHAMHAEQEENVIREHARWAKEKIQGKNA